MEDITMVAMEAEGMEEAAEAMAEVVEVAVMVAAGAEAAVAVATEDRAGKRSVTHVCLLLCGLARRHGGDKFYGLTL